MSAFPSPQLVASADDDAVDALLRACKEVMVPLAQLAVAHGLRFGELDELLRGAFVEAARDAHADVLPHRAVSRVSAATGLNRREVARLMRMDSPEPAGRSLATELFTRWLSDPALRLCGSPRRFLARQGPAPSFESLAQSVTKDVHPRTLLEEVCRLGLAKFDERLDIVLLQRDAFVPTGDEKRMFGFVGSNVGDHLRAAVDNVLNESPDEDAAGTRHLEQALFADELSPESIGRMRPLIKQQWQAVLKELAPVVQKLIDEDEARGRPRKQRLRVGMYAFNGPMDVVPRGAANSDQAVIESVRRRSK
ncbi:MAG: hypothetical protein JF606_20460 [Burkholderiales bacterium]|nr:hypothetical protein [Burkholderiales bacterium]